MLRGMNRLFTPTASPSRGQKTLTPGAILDRMAPAVRRDLSDVQLGEVERLITLALPQPSPKLVDLRFDIDLLVSRFYIVLFVGKDRRQSSRLRQVSWLTAMGNWIMAVVLLIGVNLAISAAVVMLAYLMKSALNIDLFPGHLGGFLN